MLTFDIRRVWSMKGGSVPIRVCFALFWLRVA